MPQANAMPPTLPSAPAEVVVEVLLEGAEDEAERDHREADEPGDEEQRRRPCAETGSVYGIGRMWAPKNALNAIPATIAAMQPGTRA